MSQLTQTAGVQLSLTEQLFILRRRKGWSRAEAAKRLGHGITARVVRLWEESGDIPKVFAREQVQKLVSRNSVKD
jgi:hypothetical protein